MAEVVLRPTLWRTCRVLANRERLKILALLIRERELRVSAVAARLQIPVASASVSLRALEARSILHVRRTGREVAYRFAAGGNLASLLAPLRQTLATGKHSMRLVCALATAFTHPRRIEICKTLRGPPRKLSEIRRSTGISTNALLRHLNKLQVRGFVAHQRRRDVYSVVTHTHRLGRALLELAAN
jgi:predicted ArsR family transcriptional regulator